MLMETVPPVARRTRRLHDLRKDAAGYVVLGFAASLGLCGLGVWLFDMARISVLLGLGAYMLIAGCVLAFLPAHLPHRRFGAANAATLLRASLISALIGCIGHGGGLSPLLAWALVILASAALCLDGLDGWLARRASLSSAFGARFDRELDGLMVLTLAILVWQNDKAGAWVLMIGVMHYGFAALALGVPRLMADLPKSRFRQSIGVAETILLLICLSPLMTAPWSQWLLAAGLAMLLTSFARDLVRVPGPDQSGAPDSRTRS